MTRQPIRILHIISGLEQGGAEESLHKLLAAFDPTLIQSAVVSLRPGGRIRSDMERLGVPVRDLGMQRLPTYGAIRRLRAVMRGFRPDIVEGWMTHGNLVATLASGFFGRAALVWNVRSLPLIHPIAGPFTRVLMRLSRRLSRGADAIVYNSAISATAHELYGYASAHRSIIHNGFDLGRFRPADDRRLALRERYAIPAGSPVVGQVGRWHPHKDQRTLLKAFALVRERRPDALLVLAGEGLCAENRSITELVDALGLRDAVRLLGSFRPIDEVYAMLDVFVLSSVTEAFPNVLGEAMCCGVPCIATDVGECREIIGDDSRIVAPSDAIQLAARITADLDRPPEERGRDALAARRRMASRFAIRTAAAAYESLYASLVS